MLTKQEMFNIFVPAIIKQGRKSMRNTVSTWCAYRSHDGLKCAVGMLIPDELYTPEWEQKSLSSIVEELFFSGPDRGDWEEFDSILGFLEQAQQSHDLALDSNSEFVADYIQRSKELARRHNLTWDDNWDN